MKKGVNKTDLKRILYWYGQGGTAEQISQQMKIEIGTIRKFLPEKVNESKKKVKARNKKAEIEHTAIMDAKKTPAIDPTAPSPKSE